MKAFKLVTVLKDGTMASLVPSHYRVTYALGKPTVPKIGKLFVFSSYKDARALQEHLTCDDIEGTHFQILQGTVNSKNVDMTDRVVGMCVYPSWRNQNSRKITWSWRDNGSKTSCPCYGIKCPVEKGTMLCDDFTPTRLIK